MKYLCLVYCDEARLQTLSQSDWDALNGECMAFGEAMDQAGRRLAADALEPTHTATTVRVRDGEVVTTDGPFAETKEQLAGYYAIDAKNLDEAIEFASGIPPARYGSIEIRPVRELVRTGNSR